MYYIKYKKHLTHKFKVVKQLSSFNSTNPGFHHLEEHKTFLNLPWNCISWHLYHHFIDTLQMNNRAMLKNWKKKNLLTSKGSAVCYKFHYSLNSSATFTTFCDFFSEKKIDDFTIFPGYGKPWLCKIFVCKHHHRLTVVYKIQTKEKNSMITEGNFWLLYYTSGVCMLHDQSM